MIAGISMTARPTALVTTVPFGRVDARPLELLAEAGVECVLNPLGRKLSSFELADMIPSVDVLIAGTEPITAEVIARAQRLKLISRVGVGLDSVDLLAARRAGIPVSYTPDAPAPAVAELVVGLMLTLLRSIHIADRELRQGSWRRVQGRRLHECTVGIVGLGRIGQKVLRHLAGFAPRRILLNDVVPQSIDTYGLEVEWTTREALLREADVITIHVPLTPDTRGLIRESDLRSAKADALLINTARGGIINEADLARVLRSGHLAGAAIDVFDHEPYAGELITIDRCVLTAHMGAMSEDCRARMEIEATEEAVRCLRGEPLTGLVPREEYDNQRVAAGVDEPGGGQ